MCTTTGSRAGTKGSKAKKPKKCPKVPRRGPGVAELEKVLRQQESLAITDKGNTEGFSSSCFIPHHSNPYFSSSFISHHQPPPTTQPSGMISVPNNLHSHVPSGSIFDHLVPTTPPTMILPNYGESGTLGRSGGSRLVSPEQELFLFPMNLGSCKSKSNLNEGLDGNQSDSGNSPSRNLSSEPNNCFLSFPATIQNRNNQYPPPKMNHFVGVDTTPSGSLPTEMHNHLELPSNQSSFYKSTQRAPEEYKMVDTKRSHPSSLDNSLILPDHPCCSQNKRPHQLSIIDSHGVSSFDLANECYRDAKRGRTSELNSRKFNSEIVVPGHANFPPFATPEVTEDRMEGTYQRSESNGPDSRPFYNFLEVKDLTPNHEAREAGKGGIDLILKL